MASQLALARVRRETERALRYRGEQFQTLLNQAPLGVYVVDADFRICEMNPVALPVFGDIPGGVIGRDFDEVIHILWDKEYADEMVHIFRHTLATGEPYVTPERAERRLDRGVIGVLRMASGSHYPAGRTLRVGLLLSRYRSAEAGGRREGLPCRDRRLRGRRHHVEGPQRRHSVGQRARPSACSAIPSDELVGRPVRMLIPPDRQSEEDDILTRLRKGERVEHFETVRMTKDGRRLDVALTISPVLDDAGTRSSARRRSSVTLPR